MIDVAVHVGTLGAVMTYLWRDIWMMITGLLKPGNIRRNPGLRLIAQIIVATIPLAIVGAVVYKYLGDCCAVQQLSGGRRWASASYFIWRTVYRHDQPHRAHDLGPRLYDRHCTDLCPDSGASRAGTTITMARCPGSNGQKPPGSQCCCRSAILAAGLATTLDLIESEAQHVLSDPL